MDKNQNEFEWMDVALEHHGVDGQSWGLRRGPPYPLSRQDKKANAEKARTKKRIAKKRKMVEKAAKKQEKAEAKAVKEEERKAETLRQQKKKYSKTPNDVYKHKDLYSNEELKEILSRFDVEEKVKDYQEKDHKRRAVNADSVDKVLKSIAGMAVSAITIYNIANAVQTAFGDSPPKHGPVKITKPMAGDKK